MNEIIEVFANVGFPIGVSVYLLVRFESKIEKLDDSIVNLSKIIENKFS